MSALSEKHIQIVEALNNAPTEAAHEHWKAVLQGFREALKIIDVQRSHAARPAKAQPERHEPIRRAAG